MVAIIFDTHSFVKRLVTAGMPEEQAEILAHEQTRLIDETLATKRDLKELELRLKSEMHAAEQRMTIKLGGMLVVAVGMIVTLQKLL